MTDPAALIQKVACRLRQSGLLTDKQLADELEARTGQLVPRAAVEGAVEALEPFANFAANFVDDDGWNGVGLSVHKERISYWFGPSEFRAARAALASIKENERADRRA